VGLEYGANSDSPSDAGLAHLLEHMLNSGSRKRDKMIEIIENLGGNYELGITREVTFAALQVSSESVEEASRILREMVFRPVFEKKKLDIQKQVVLQEIDEYFGDPDWRVDHMLMETLFGDHSVGRPIGGFSKTVKALSLKKVNEAHRTYYTAGNTILAIVGNYSENDVESFSQRFLDSVNAKSLPTKRSDLSRQQAREVMRVKRGLNRAYIAMGARAVPATDPDSAALVLACSILGGCHVSRLFKELREKRGLAYYVDSVMEQGSDYGHITAHVSVKPRNLQKALRIMRSEFLKLGERRVPVRELDRVKRSMIGRAVNIVDDPDEFPELMVDFEFLYRDENALARYLEEVSNVGVDDIVEAANKYLDEDNLTTAVLKP
jgi:predicted Zn-dependent peptidase